MRDRRVVYGARCSWWGSINEVSTLPSGMSCCPSCRGVLFEYDNEEEWWEGVDQYEAEGNPGYRAFIEWLRGRCRPSVGEARAEFDRISSL